MTFVRTLKYPFLHADRVRPLTPRTVRVPGQGAYTWGAQDASNGGALAPKAVQAFCNLNGILRQF